HSATTIISPLSLQTLFRSLEERARIYYVGLDTTQRRSPTPQRSETTMLALLFSAIVLLSLTLTSTAASALPTCVELGSDPAFGLVGNPDLRGVSTSLVPAA